MITSDKGIQLLMLREGVRLKAYRDVKGIWTVGVGHTGPEVVEGLVINQLQAMSLLHHDVITAEECINKNVKVPLTENQFDALVSFVFNVGVGAFTRSTMLRKLNVGDYEGCAKEFDKWHIPIQITSRRDSERDQFLS
jgi:lysozyme